MIRSVETTVRSRRVVVLLFVTSAVIVAIDQTTKALVVSHLREGESRRVIGRALSWTYQRNPGSAFGFFQHVPVLFTILAAAIAVVIVVRAPRVHDRLTGFALGLVLGGAIGNLVDRFRLGYVVDFLDVYVNWGGQTHHWPAFNVADSAICIGIGLLFLDMKKSEPVNAQTA